MEPLICARPYARFGDTEGKGKLLRQRNTSQDRQAQRLGHLCNRYLGSTFQAQDCAESYRLGACPQGACNLEGKTDKKQMIDQQSEQCIWKTSLWYKERGERFLKDIAFGAGKNWVSVFLWSIQTKSRINRHIGRGLL